MRITFLMGFFLPVPPLRGGATERACHQLAREFSLGGHEVTIVSRLCDGLPERENNDGINHIRLRGYDHARLLPVNLLHDFIWSLRLTRFLPPSDATITNSITLPLVLRAIPDKAGRIFPLIGRMPKRQTHFYGNVSGLIAASAAVAEKLRRESRWNADKISLIPYPLGFPFPEDRPAKRDKSKPITIGYLGRIHPEKGLLLLLQAAEHLSTLPGLPAWRLIIQGPWKIEEGGGGKNYRDALISEFSPKLRDRLIFLEPIFDATELLKSYSTIDIFCYPSLAEHGETFGVAVAEAMAAGAVPVVSSLPCFLDLVTNEKSGLIFDHASPSAASQLASRLEALIKHPDHLADLSTEARNTVRQLDAKSIANRWLKVLERP